MISIAALQIVATTLDGFAQFCTLLRLEFNRRRKKIRIEDALAAFAMLCSFTALVCFWITTETAGAGPIVESQVSRFRAYWIFTTTTILVIWLSRVAIILSCVRAIPTFLKIPGYILSGFVAAMGMCLFVFKIYFCARDSDWKMLDVPTCPDNSVQRLLNILFELLSDVLMLIAPIGLSSDRGRLLYLVIGVALTSSSVVHIVFFIRSDTNPETLTSIIQVAVFLVMTNLPALLNYYFSLYDDNDNDNDNVPGSSRDMEHLQGAPKVLRPWVRSTSSEPQIETSKLPPPPSPYSSTSKTFPIEVVREKPKATVTDRLSASSVSAYSVVSGEAQTVHPSEDVKQGKGSRLSPTLTRKLSSRRARGEVYSYSSIFAQYITDERPGSVGTKLSESRPWLPSQALMSERFVGPFPQQNPVPF